MENKEKIKEEVKEKISQLDAVEIMKDFINDNKQEFVIKDITYRIRPLNAQEKAMARKERSRKLKELLDDSTWLLQKQLIQKYKDRGVDIENMKVIIRKLESEKESVELRLLEVKDTKDKDDFEKKIIDIKTKQMELAREISDLLSDSLEEELLLHDNSYVLWLSLEKKVEDKYIRAFDNFDDFINIDDNDLMITAGYYYTVMGMKKNEI